VLTDTSAAIRSQPIAQTHGTNVRFTVHRLPSGRDVGESGRTLCLSSLLTSKKELPSGSSTGLIPTGPPRSFAKITGMTDLTTVHQGHAEICESYGELRIIATELRK
jgi:hypothetical protein